MSKRASDDAGYAPYAEGAHPPYYYERYQSSTRRAPRRPLFAPPRTLSELTGPVFSDDEVATRRERSLDRAATASPCSGS